MTFGWAIADTGETRDRTTASPNNPKLSGINYTGSADQALFQVDLPATGDYTIRVANGDAGSSQAGQYWELRDNVTAFVTAQFDGGMLGDEYYDATQVLRTTPTNWINNNATVTRTFASTTFVFALAKTIDYGTNHVVAHLFLSQIESGGASPVQPQRRSFWIRR